MWWRIALLGLTVVAPWVRSRYYRHVNSTGRVAADSTEARDPREASRMLQRGNRKGPRSRDRVRVDRILITAFVEPLEVVPHLPGQRCRSLVVELSEPVMDRELVDAYCLNPEVAGYVWCRESEGIRWPLRR